MDYMQKAQQWYEQHENHVNKLIENYNENISFRPSLEDLERPEVWNPGHWLWFFEERKKN